MAELNNYVRTVSHTGPLTEEFLRKFRVVVLTNSDGEEQQRIAKFAHENGIALIIAETRGLFAKVFCDFGESFTIYDQDGTQPISTMIASITHDAQESSPAWTRRAMVLMTVTTSPSRRCRACRN